MLLQLDNENQFNKNNMGKQINVWNHCKTLGIAIRV